MEKLDALIERYGLSEDEEHVIIPYTGSEGRRKRIFLLRRPNLIVRRGPENHITVPIEEIVEALVKNPEGSLWETLELEERMLLEESRRPVEEEKEAPEAGEDYREDSPPEASGREGSSQDRSTGSIRPSSTRTLPEKG